MILGLSIPKFLGAIFVGLVLSMVLISVLSSITSSPEVKEESKSSTCYISELSNSPSLMQAQCNVMKTMETSITLLKIVIGIIFVTGIISFFYRWNE